SSCNEKSEGKRKGRPRVEMQELRTIPETLAEKLSHSCPYCEAVFASKVRLQKHKLWNHPERVSLETLEPKTDPRQPLHKDQKTHVKGNGKKRPAENRPPSPVVFKLRRVQETPQLSQNGRCATHRLSTDTGGSESEGGSLPPPFPDEDPERSKHRRKQKTPKKFTGEQPSISGTFGLKGMNKVEEKLKAGRMKRAEGPLLQDESQKKQLPQTPPRREVATISPVPPLEVQWQNIISEQGEVVCPTCSVVTRKTLHGLKKHMEICQKLRDALKCQQCQKQFRSKAALNYHNMTVHIKSSASENMSKEEHKDRERQSKQSWKIKCPNEGCSAHFFTLMSYQYHQKRCARELPDTQKPVFLCQHCGKTYRSKAGRDYHQRTEHSLIQTTDSYIAEDREKENSKDEENELEEEHEDHEKGDTVLMKSTQDREGEHLEERTQGQELLDLDRTPSGRVRRRSAQVAVFHLQEIAEDELAKDWGTKRRIKDDLVPDIKRLNYTRPGLPTFSPETVDSWKNEVKEKGFICCPNGNCEAIYSSVSGLKAHLASCNKGGGDIGKYTCLLCQKEFNSESGVKYHINKTHAQNWFRATTNELNNQKKKEPESNGLQGDIKSIVTGKKRGRKPKEQDQTIPVLSTTKTPASHAPQHPYLAPENHNPMPQPALKLPVPRAESKSSFLARDTQPPLKKRGKIK
ncbi:hypothetical protein DNTS_035146, partial [Danionella cerebrum]